MEKTQHTAIITVAARENTNYQQHAEIQDSKLLFRQCHNWFLQLHFHFAIS